MGHGINLWLAGGLAVATALGVVIFMNVRISLYTFRFLLETPPFIWMTLDDLEKKGYPTTYFRVILPRLYQYKMLEVRPRDRIAEVIEHHNRSLAEMGVREEFTFPYKAPNPDPFAIRTVHLYEFRLIVRRRRRKFRRKLFGLPGLTGGLQPAT
jgi:hypothetical protein